MIKIRFQKQGAKNRAFYRLVAIDKKRKVAGKQIDILGFYNPSTKEFKIDNDKYEKWVSKGAQVSRSVSALIAK